MVIFKGDANISEELELTASILGKDSIILTCLNL